MRSQEDEEWDARKSCAVCVCVCECGMGGQLTEPCVCLMCVCVCVEKEYHNMVRDDRKEVMLTLERGQQLKIKKQWRWFLFILERKDKT